MTFRDDERFGEQPTARPRYRPPAGLPLRRDDDYRVGALVAIGLHALAVLLILTPLFVATMIAAPPTGAGGAGPAGGGGGGTRGTGGAPGEYAPERLRYIQIGPAQPAAPAPAAEEPEPVPPTPPPPEEKPEPEPTPPVSQTPPAPTAEPLAGSADAQGAAASPTAGSGGGTGDDGTAGSGPGSGGGIGSGVGTGIGSGDGPGTGGGTGDVYLPTPTLSVFPNRKPRSAVAGDSILVLFDVDESGRVLRIEFPPTKDRGFNKYLAEVLENWKFRPAVRQDGTPVRATYPLTILL